MTDGKRRSSYRPPQWPEPSGAVVATHDHEQPRKPFIILGTAILLLFLSTGLTFMHALSVQDRLAALDRSHSGLKADYEALKVQRNQQLSDLDQRINEAQCDLLDTLPVTALLDAAREKYGCGPGLPVDQLSPQAQQELGASSLLRPQVLPGDVLPGVPDIGGLGPSIPPTEPGD